LRAALTASRVQSPIVRRRVTATLGEYHWRPLTDSAADTDFVIALRTNPRYARWFYHPQITAQTHQKFIAAADERGEINWVVQRRDTGQPVGLSAVYHIDAVNRKAECGRTIFLEPRIFHLNWVVSAVTSFDVLSLNKAYIETLAENRIVARGVARMGMTREALLRAHVWRDGRPLDVLLYTILGDEWRAIREGALQKWGTPQVLMADAGARA
jgi:RimJ/RimL family protein N-acetyltransferase